MQALTVAEHYDFAGFAAARTAHTFTLTFTSDGPLSEEQSRRMHEAIASSIATSVAHTERHVRMRFGVDLQVNMNEELT